MTYRKMKEIYALAKEQGVDIKTVAEFADFAKKYF